jgi:hypothetical protein
MTKCRIVVEDEIVAWLRESEGQYSFDDGGGETKFRMILMLAGEDGTWG